jgi:hypothetical protein
MNCGSGYELIVIEEEIAGYNQQSKDMLFEGRSQILVTVFDLRNCRWRQRIEGVCFP